MTHVPHWLLRWLDDRVMRMTAQRRADFVDCPDAGWRHGRAFADANDPGSVGKACDPSPRG